MVGLILRKFFLSSFHLVQGIARLSAFVGEGGKEKGGMMALAALTAKGMLMVSKAVRGAWTPARGHPELVAG